MNDANTCILVIEDTHDIAQMLTLLLARADRSVVHVANGQAALEYLNQATQLPTLILLDLNMPIMDGWAFRAIQHDHTLWRDVPVIVLSAVGDCARLQREMPGVSVLLKPFDPPALIELVAQYTDHSLTKG